MKKVSLEEVDLNYFSAELNNLQLISDYTRLTAARAANFTDMCSVLLSELKGKKLADYFLDLLGSYPKTKTICNMLRKVTVATQALTVTRRRSPRLQKLTFLVATAPRWSLPTL